MILQPLRLHRATVPSVELRNKRAVAKVVVGGLKSLV